MARKALIKLLFVISVIVFPLSGMAQAANYTDAELKALIGDYMTNETGTMYADFVEEVERWTGLDRKARNIAGSNGVDERVYEVLKSIPNLADIVTGGAGVKSSANRDGYIITTEDYNTNLTKYITDKSVGFRITREDDGYTSAVTLVINGDLDATGPVVSLWPHFDTVVDRNDKNPDGTPITYKYNPVTKTATGPAVGDSTASCVMTLYMVKVFAEMKAQGKTLPFHKIIIWWDGNEEGGAGSAATLPQRGFVFNNIQTESDICLHMDTGRPVYGTAVLRKSGSNFTFKARGITGHGSNGNSSTIRAHTQLMMLYRGLLTLTSPIPGMDKHVNKPGMKIYAGHPLNDPTVFDPFDTSKQTKLEAMGQGKFDKGQFLPDCQIMFSNLTSQTTVNGMWEADLTVNLRCFYPDQFAALRTVIRDLESTEEYTVEGMTYKKLDPVKLKALGVPVIEGGFIALTSRGNEYAVETTPLPGAKTAWGGFDAYDNRLLSKRGDTAVGTADISSRDMLEEYRRIMRDVVQTVPYNVATFEQIDVSKKEFDGISEWYAAGGTYSNTTFNKRPTLDTLAIDAHPLIEHTYRDTAILFTFGPRVRGLALLIQSIGNKTITHKTDWTGTALPPKDRYPYTSNPVPSY